MRNLLFLLPFICSNVFAQIEVKHFNAEWNSSNGVSWFMDLEDCKTKSTVDIAKDA